MNLLCACLKRPKEVFKKMQNNNNNNNKKQDDDDEEEVLTHLNPGFITVSKKVQKKKREKKK